MLNANITWQALGPQLQVLIVVAVVIAVSLALITLVVWWRTPAERITGPNRWVWLPVILLVSLVGPLAFLLFGRRRYLPHDEVVPAAGSPAEVTDLLYPHS